MLLPLRYRRAWIALYWLLVAAIAITSLLPMESLPGAPPGVDKLEHLLAYFSLAFLGIGLVPQRGLVTVVVFVLALGAGLEVAQGLLAAGRIADWIDLAANAAGVGLAAWLGRRGCAGWAARVEERITGRGG